MGRLVSSPGLAAGLGTRPEAAPYEWAWCVIATVGGEVMRRKGG